ncbi:MAG: hypothetical protein WB778_06350 [Thermoplasmata archaeon]
MSARRFARLRRGNVPEAEGYFVLPDDGLCLNTFLVLRHPREKGRVLLGRIDPRAAWYEFGALEPARVQGIGRRWMLPSSQLLFFESPLESAQRIAREQLESPLPPVEGPLVVSEQYRRSTSHADDPHWDLHFIYQGTWPNESPPAAHPWQELAFVEVSQTPASEIARSQGDVLELAGLSLANSPSKA